LVEGDEGGEEGPQALRRVGELELKLDLAGMADDLEDEEQEGSRGEEAEGEQDAVGDLPRVSSSLCSILALRVELQFLVQVLNVQLSSPSTGRG